MYGTNKLISKKEMFLVEKAHTAWSIHFSSVGHISNTLVSSLSNSVDVEPGARPYRTLKKSTAKNTREENDQNIYVWVYLFPPSCLL